MSTTPTPSRYSKGLMWFRRDLRTDDNVALFQALKQCQQVWTVFVFDTTILQHLPKADRRVEFIRESLVDLSDQLHRLGETHGVAGVRLLVLHGDPQTLIPELAHQLGAEAVFANHDDEPAALARDAKVLGALAHAGRMFHTHKDHVVFERNEVLTQQNRPFGVFTPYKQAWLRALSLHPPVLHDVPAWAHRLAACPPEALVHAQVPSLHDLGFEPTNLKALKLPTGSQGAETLWHDFVHRLDRYGEVRDFPALKGPSYLSVHLRFGTLSIRRLVQTALTFTAPPHATQGGAATWLSELIWRDFYHQILAHHPRVVTEAFKSEYDRISWRRDAQAQADFAAWCRGETGYPLVDAAMRQLNQTGYMHNRLRMVTASFLCKHLGLDWRWGEKYFAEHLNDFDLAANNGGWQWASSSGCDAQPYFRIFNPINQSQKFDAEGKFIRRYVPELSGLSNTHIHTPWLAPAQDRLSAGVELGRNYPAPIVDHATARQQTLERYSVVKRPS